MKGRCNSNTSRKTVTNQKRTKRVSNLSTKKIRRKPAKPSLKSKRPSRSTSRTIDTVTTRSTAKQNNNKRNSAKTVRKYVRRNPKKSTGVRSTATVTGSCSKGHPLPECGICTKNNKQHKNDLDVAQRSNVTSSHAQQSGSRDHIDHFRPQRQRLRGQLTSKPAVVATRRTYLASVKCKVRVNDGERTKKQNNNNNGGIAMNTRSKKRERRSATKRYIAFINSQYDYDSDTSSVIVMDTDDEAIEEREGEELARIPSTTTVASSSVAGVSLRDVKREEPLVRRGGRVYQRVMMTCPYNLRRFKDGERCRMREVRKLEMVDYFKKRFVIT